MTGSFPEHRVIHVDGDKTNYTWDNLAPEEKTYHGKGSITWVEKRQHYQAMIGDKYIGVFKTKEEAAAALDSAHLSADMTREQAAKRLMDCGISGVEAKQIFSALNQVLESP